MQLSLQGHTLGALSEKIKKYLQGSTADKFMEFLPVIMVITLPHSYSRDILIYFQIWAETKKKTCGLHKTKLTVSCNIADALQGRFLYNKHKNAFLKQ